MPTRRPRRKAANTANPIINIGKSKGPHGAGLGADFDLPETRRQLIMNDLPTLCELPLKAGTRTARNLAAMHPPTAVPWKGGHLATADATDPLGAKVMLMCPWPVGPSPFLQAWGFTAPRAAAAATQSNGVDPAPPDVSDEPPFDTAGLLLAASASIASSKLLGVDVAAGGGAGAGAGVLAFALDATATCVDGRVPTATGGGFAVSGGAAVAGAVAAATADGAAVAVGAVAAAMAPPADEAVVGDVVFGSRGGLRLPQEQHDDDREQREMLMPPRAIISVLFVFCADAVAPSSASVGGAARPGWRRRRESTSAAEVHDVVDVA